MAPVSIWCNWFLKESLTSYKNSNWILKRLKNLVFFKICCRLCHRSTVDLQRCSSTVNKVSQLSHMQIPKTNQHTATDTKRVSLSGRECGIVSNNQTCWHVLPPGIFSIWGHALPSYFELLCKCMSSPTTEVPTLWVAPRKLALVPVNSSSVCIIVSAARHTQERTNKHLY